MRKLFTLFIAMLLGFTANTAMANDVFTKGDVLGSFTVGFGNGFAQKLAIDYGLVDNGWLDGKASLGLGASLANTIQWNSHWDDLSLIVNCSFHYQFIENLDTYVVAGIGGRMRFAGDHVGGGVDWTSSLGLRHYLTQNFALNVEAGHTNGSFVNLGVTCRF